MSNTPSGTPASSRGTPVPPGWSEIDPAFSEIDPEFLQAEFLYSIGKPVFIRKVHVRDTPESLGDKLIRWSEPLERRIPLHRRGTFWLLWGLSCAIVLGAIALGCWIRGESFMALMALTWRDLS